MGIRSGNVSWALEITGKPRKAAAKAQGLRRAFSTANFQLLHASLNPPSSLNFQGMASGESRGMHPPLPLRLDGSKQESFLTTGDKNTAPIDSKD